MVNLFKSYILSLMRDERRSVVDLPAKGVLRVLSWIYALAVEFVNLEHRSGFYKTGKVPVPVVSVGNITLGGTGKTPFVLYIADRFLARGRKPAILTRGYGDDEHRLLEEQLPAVQVVVGKDRVKSARLAVGNGADTIIMDDGFQARSLVRDIDILLVDGVRLFGNRLLCPAGYLREPVLSIYRADIIVVTRSDLMSPEDKKNAIKVCGAPARGVPIIFARHKAVDLRDSVGRSHPMGALQEADVCIVSGIAEPRYFSRMVEDAGGVVKARLDFPDHHKFREGDIALIRKKFVESGASMIITTQKDYVKLKRLKLQGIEDKLFVMNIRIEITEGEDELIDRLERGVSGSRA